MRGHFDSFIDNISEEIHTQTKTYISTSLAIFEPKSFIIGQETCFDDYHFILLYSNPPPAKIGRKQYQFKKGSLISFEAGQDLTILPTSNREHPSKYIDITVKKDFFEKIAIELNQRNKISFKKIETSFSYHLVESIAAFKNEVSAFGDSYPLMTDSIATQIVVQLLRDINSDTSHYTDTTIFKDQQLIKKAIDYMQSYYSSGITIEDICQTVNLSPNYFIRRFKEQTGQTPYQYLMEIRVRKAEQMLIKSKYSIGEIATLCGFVNSGHFATLFKRYVGTSPSEYRQQIIGLIRF